MATDDFLLDQLERDQQQQTQRRRDHRSRRRHLYTAVALMLVVLILLGAPSLASHSSIGRSLLNQTLAAYELDSKVESIRIGWVTPLRIQGLRIQGAQGSQILIDQLDADVTVMDLIRSGATDLGEVSVRGVEVRCAVDQGRCNLEDDLRLLLAPSDEPSSIAAIIKLQDVSLSATDAVTASTWSVNQSSGEASISASKIEATFAGVLTEPGGSGGSIQGAILYSPELIERGSNTGEPARLWRLQISCESLPVSVAALVRRRFNELTDSLPRSIHGDATGGVVVQSLGDGTIEVVLDDLRVRNLTAADDGSRVWSNGLATIRGSLVLRGERVIGHQLQAATDFASATIDGAFSRTFSFVGANDNPLRWLDAIDGTATAEIDLAALDRSLPGLLPLRSDAIILSGQIRGKVDSSPNGATRRSRLFIETEPLRARAGSQAVVIDPVKLSAVVSNVGGQLRADQFEWSSAFGGAVGHGDLRSGVADFEIDFGRLTSMLRPILQIGETSLSGSANGSVRWDAAADSVWRLSGSADANNLLIAFPSGQSLRRASLRGTVDAVGRWGDGSLEELSSANLTIVSSGLDVQAELVQPVQQPHADVPLPLKLRGTGRLETLTETFGPWLPRELVDLAGGFQFTALSNVATTATQLTNASVELTEPSMVYAGRQFGQSKVQIQFDGSYRWPANLLEARDLTISGNAFSSRVSGKMNEHDVDLDIQWRALLDRIQGSVRRPMAADANTPFRPVGYRNGGTVSSQATEADQWTLQGDCEGSVVLKKSKPTAWEIAVDASARNLAMLQPWSASAQYRLVGPVPTHGASAGQTTTADRSLPAGQAVWAEPNLKLNGSFRYDSSANEVTTDSIQIASDWFATTLKGRLAQGPHGQELLIEGPARLKMDEIATRLTSLLGFPIRAEGVHETPLLIRAGPPRDGQSLSGSTQLTVQASVGWEAADVAGVPLGRASVPVRLTETTVEISPSRIPVGQGFVNLAGQVHHRPGPIWIQLDRGVVAESVRLTPAMTSRWLKYLAPLAAEATQVDGILGAELDEAVIVFDRPEQSRVVGRLNIGSVQLNAGPLADQVLSGIQQLKSLSGALNAPVENSAGKTLIRMPAQTVDFAVHQGVVSHDRLFFEIDRAQVVTSGRVAFDGRLNMIAMVPLDARWLGSDLKGLAGQTVTLPIDGTLSRPSLDSSGVAQLVTQLGTQAVQSTAENYLQQQLNRGLEKLFGR